MHDDGCPCGGGSPYDTCCGPLHRGERDASTALELMKSRYAAFAHGLVDYLVRTHRSDEPEPARREGLARSVASTRWLGLRILDTVAGGPGDRTGVVEFEATFQTGDERGAMRERSRFAREAGRWVYLDAVDRAAFARSGAGRNEPCPCGSGAKFKKCCGR